MVYTLGNKCAKNFCKRIVLLQLIIENVVTCFFGTQCSFFTTQWSNHSSFMSIKHLREIPMGSPLTGALKQAGYNNFAIFDQ